MGMTGISRVVDNPWRRCYKNKFGLRHFGVSLSWGWPVAGDRAAHGRRVSGCAAAAWRAPLKGGGTPGTAGKAARTQEGEDHARWR